MSTLACIGVLAHPLRPKTFPIAHRITDSLRARGIQTWLHTEWREQQIERAMLTSAGMVVAIGGDGAMLRAARVCAPHGIPVLGVNMGQLGFLTEIDDPDQWDTHLQSILDGGYWIEERMMLRASVTRGGDTVCTGDALNDIVISGGIIGRMIQLDAYIDDDWTTTYHADALVIATATGSTAYALACGGPILPPELKNILVVPAAPHLSMDRPIVLAEGARVDVEPASGNRNEIVLSADGGVLYHLKAGDRVCIQASDHSTRFVRLRGRNYFYRSLLDKLEPRVQRSRVENRR